MKLTGTSYETLRVQHFCQLPYAPCSRGPHLVCLYTPTTMPNSSKNETQLALGTEQFQSWVLKGFGVVVVVEKEEEVVVVVAAAAAVL